MEFTFVTGFISLRLFFSFFIFLIIFCATISSDFSLNYFWFWSCFLGPSFHDQKSSRFLSGRACFFRRIDLSWSSNSWFLYGFQQLPCTGHRRSHPFPARCWRLLFCCSLLSVAIFTSTCVPAFLFSLVLLWRALKSTFVTVVHYVLIWSVRLRTWFRCSFRSCGRWFRLSP